jgi:alpha-galactosidase
MKKGEAKMKKLFVSLCLMGVLASAAEAKPLKVYILCGQSNMEGHAKISTFDYIGKDPKTAPILKEMLGPDGKPRVCEKVWISYYTNSKEPGEGFGKLTAGYGARSNPEESGGKIGPEFTFGIYMQKLLNEPILIIKAAWGGKSINTDFRPPSAGPYRFNEQQLESLKKRDKNIEEAKADKASRTGHFYRLMIEHVKKVLADPKRVCPVYDPKEGYELAGFVWFQGWNDMVDGGTYPNRGKPGGYDKYSEVLAHFIRDVRKDLKAPKMRFVIGVMGAGGPTADYKSKRYVGIHQCFRDAMAAPASMPEFKGNVVAVLTEKCWDPAIDEVMEKRGKISLMARNLKSKHKDGPNKDGSMDKKAQQEYLKKYEAELMTDKDREVLTGVSNAGFHYFGSAKIFAQIGKAFAEAMVEPEIK